MNRAKRLFSFRKIQGFTLIEIVVAMAVFSLSIVVLINSVGQAARDLSNLKARMVGLNIAEQALNRVLLVEEFPELGRREEVITFSEQDWLVEIEVSDPFVESEDARRIDVTVQPYDSDSNIEQKTTLLSGFRVNIF